MGSRRKACHSCVKAKRRCDLRLPRCGRCSTRGLECYYGTRTEAQQANSDVPLAIEEGLLDFSSLDNFVASDQPNVNDADQSLGTLISNHPANSSETTQKDSMDLSSLLYPDIHVSSLPLTPLDDLAIHYGPQSEAIDVDILLLCVGELKKWLQQWITHGSAPFIHRQLYHDNLPHEIQDAYSSCAIYFTKNPSNHRMVFRIIEDRVVSLLKTHSHGSLPGPLFQHLVRVHSLLVYQIIQLFDGDIRQRAMAEQHAPILHSWLQKMWEAFMLSGLDVYHGNSSSVEKQQQMESPFISSRWEEWLVAESVRRTWITARVTQCIYETMKNGLSACPGGTIFTANTDIWNAPSAYRWAKACREHSRHIVSSGRLHRLIHEARANEVDDFGKVMMLFIHSRETLEEWIDETGSAGVGPVQDLMT